MNRILLRGLIRKGVKVICFLADINGLKDGNAATLKKEIRFLRRFSSFIVHNDKMQEWLEQTIPGSHAEKIEFFDFLAKPATTEHTFSYEIIFAGYLEKSRFLEKLDQLQSACPSVHFQLYGRGQTPCMLKQSKVSWNGIHKPHEMPSKLKGSFGLVWDGDSIEGPGGSLGDYMRYISHHKLSLYLLAGLPLIVPSFAASAPLIEKYKIGITVNSLFELEERIKQVSPEEHRQMQANTKEIANRISRGAGLRQALELVMVLDARC
jgi:hypothetical protein